MDTLAAADDFAVAFGREHVEGKGQIGTLGVGLHVERFDGSWVAVDHNRPVELVGDDGFFVATDVIAEFRGIALLLQQLDGVFVADPRKRRLHVFELLGVALQRFQLARLVFAAPIARWR